MITGTHAIIYSKDAQALRDFFRDVLEFDSADTGGGWLIFTLPPAELGIHPTEGSGAHALYLMCDDIDTTVKELEAKGVEFVRPIEDAGWGLMTAMRVPGGGELGIYEPRHASPGLAKA
jgi:predicted enzyme related to lactoylglutathione lyase